MLVSIIIVSGCRKDTLDVAPQSESHTSPLSALSNLWESENADFFINISSSYGVSLYDSEEFSVDRASTIVEAASATEKNVGNLAINEIEIPFQTLSYAKQTDPKDLKPSFLLGKVNNYKFTGTDFPSFDISQYSPTATNLSFIGLKDKKLSREGSLDIYWESDKELPTSAKALLIVYAEDESGEKSQTIQKEVVDLSSNATLNTEELALFKEFSHIRIFYAKGYNQIYNIEDKKIDLRFVNFSYARIYFAD